MNLLKLKNKKAQEGLSAVMRWILYLGILAAVTFAFRAIIIRFKG